MNDFNPNKFSAGALLLGLGVAATVASSIRSPASIADEQRLIDHDILRAQIARSKSRAARHEAEAALACLDASAALRLAAISAGVFQR